MMTVLDWSALASTEPTQAGSKLSELGTPPEAGAFRMRSRVLVVRVPRGRWAH